MSRRLRKLRSLENQLLRVYSAWQETHRLELADQWMTVVGELLKIKPGYSVRQPFQQAF